MKIGPKAMVHLLLFQWLSALGVLGIEGFVNFPGETSTILVATNEAIILTSTIADMSNYWPLYRGRGQEFNFRLGKGAIYSGPCELSITTKCSIAFERFSAPQIQTILLTNIFMRTNHPSGERILPRITIPVPAGKVLTVLPFYDGFIYGSKPGETNAQFLYGPPPADDPKQMDPLQFLGPIDLQFESLPSWAPLTYSIENAQQARITTEISGDLNQWIPIWSRHVPFSDTNAFFRLLISR